MQLFDCSYLVPHSMLEILWVVSLKSFIFAMIDFCGENYEKDKVELQLYSSRGHNKSTVSPVFLISERRQNFF